jgi:hypothetical protein
MPGRVRIGFAVDPLSFGFTITPNPSDVTRFSTDVGEILCNGSVLYGTTEKKDILLAGYVLKGRSIYMQFFEWLFGFWPDGGSGTFETILLMLPIAGALLAATRRATFKKVVDRTQHEIHS